MSVTELRTEGSVAVLTMTNGANKQNPEFAQSMKSQLQAVLDNEDHKALVLASNDEKNWSQGIDTDWLMAAMKEKRVDEVKDFMFTMDEVFKTLLLMPIPVIAAINGHAFGNGAILACACDFRFMRADKGFFCFPEVDLSIPFMPGMIAFIKKAIPYYRFNELKLTGRRATADELAVDHVLEKAFPDAQSLEAGVMAFAASFDKKRGIFGEHKKRLHKAIIETIDSENPPLINDVKLMV